MPRKPFTRLSNLDHNLSIGVLVDPEDIDLLETHRFRAVNGYPMATINRKGTYLHRLVHSRKTGRSLEDYARNDYVRHIIPNGFDCRGSNLYEKTGATANQCDANVAKNPRNKSGTSGVCWFTPTKQWRVGLTYHGRNIHLGYFDSLEEASRVARHCRITREGITSSDTPMDFKTMKDLLQSEAKTIVTI